MWFIEHAREGVEMNHHISPLPSRPSVAADRNLRDHVVCRADWSIVPNPPPLHCPLVEPHTVSIPPLFYTYPLHRPFLVSNYTKGTFLLRRGGPPSPHL